MEKSRLGRGVELFAGSVKAVRGGIDTTLDRPIRGWDQQVTQGGAEIVETTRRAMLRSVAATHEQDRHRPDGQAKAIRSEHRSAGVVFREILGLVPESGDLSLPGRRLLNVHICDLLAEFGDGLRNNGSRRGQRQLDGRCLPRDSASGRSEKGKVHGWSEDGIILE